MYRTSYFTFASPRLRTTIVGVSATSRHNEVAVDSSEIVRDLMLFNQRSVIMATGAVNNSAPAMNVHRGIVFTIPATAPLLNRLRVLNAVVQRTVLQRSSFSGEAP